MKFKQKIMKSFELLRKIALMLAFIAIGLFAICVFLHPIETKASKAQETCQIVYSFEYNKIQYDIGECWQWTPYTGWLYLSPISYCDGVTATPCANQGCKTWWTEDIKCESRYPN